jgi:hypothetical protein
MEQNIFAYGSVVSPMWFCSRDCVVRFDSSIQLINDIVPAEFPKEGAHCYRKECRAYLKFHNRQANELDGGLDDVFCLLGDIEASQDKIRDARDVGNTEKVVELLGTLSSDMELLSNAVEEFIYKKDELDQEIEDEVSEDDEPDWTEENETEMD